MSIKWIGCGLIFLACLALASEGCGALRRRERCLTELDGLLTAFLGEIRFGMQPLPVLLERPAAFFAARPGLRCKRQ